MTEWVDHALNTVLLPYLQADMVDGMTGRCVACFSFSLVCNADRMLWSVIALARQIHGCRANEVTATRNTMHCS